MVIITYYFIVDYIESYFTCLRDFPRPICIFKTIYEIERFLRSRWFAFLYPDLDPDIIKTTLQNKSKATYGALIGHDRINKINAKLKYWVPTHYNRKGLRNG